MKKDQNVNSGNADVPSKGIEPQISVDIDPYSNLLDLEPGEQEPELPPR
jgi:hypothetical protein